MEEGNYTEWAGGGGGVGGGGGAQAGGQCEGPVQEPHPSNCGRVPIAESPIRSVAGMEQ
jgi:hypothetical protein